MDPIVLIAQIHASGLDAADRLRKAGLGELAELSKATPAHVAKILEISRTKAQALIRDVRRELKEDSPRPPARKRVRKKAAATAPARQRQDRPPSRKEEGLSLQETEALLATDRPRPEKKAPSKPKSAKPPSRSGAREVPHPLPDSFWRFG